MKEFPDEKRIIRFLRGTAAPFCRLKFDAPSLQRNSKPAGRSGERLFNPRSPRPLETTVKPERGAASRLDAAVYFKFCGLFHLTAAATVLFSAEVSAFLRVEVLFSLQTHTRAHTHRNSRAKIRVVLSSALKGQSSAQQNTRTHTRQRRIHA